jgi:putative flippase GtrA
MKIPLLSAEVVRFIIVGAAAAAVHFICVLFLVEQWAFLPLLANVAAFLLAFNVSYTGHRFWTFSDTSLEHSESLPRFFLVACCGFACNELLYFLLLHYTPLPYWLSLGLVLLAVAFGTFVFSRLWAFARHQ